MNKLLVDTNVLIYSIDEDSKYFKSAQKIFSEELELYTTSKNLSEFLSVVTRFPQKSLSLKEALLVVDDFMKTMTILYPTKETFFVFRDLIKRYQPVGLQIHDYEILSIGLANQVDTVATFNEKDFIKVKEAKLYTL